MTAFTPEEDAAILRGGWDDRTLADMLFMPIEMLRDRRAALSKPPYLRGAVAVWTDEEKLFLRRSVRQGHTLRHIALQMGRTETSVRCRNSYREAQACR